MKRLIATAFLATALSSPASAAPATTYVVLVDRAERAVGAEKSAYLETFGKVRKALAPGDRVVIATAGRRLVAERVRELDAEVPPRSEAKASANFAGDLRMAMESTLEAEPPGQGAGYRMADSVSAAGELFASTPANRKVLVVLSPLAGDPGRPKPDDPSGLAGVRAHFAGVRTGGEFWRDYFSRIVGSEIVSFGSGAANVKRTVSVP